MEASAMSEKPLERLNYHNGQRLEASDLKTEQDYFIRVRRWLNKSLYQPGIASGLTVRPEGDTLRVLVSPGLALDAEGREIILLEEAFCTVPGPGPGNLKGEAAGLYLVIQYAEYVGAYEQTDCNVSRKPAGRPAEGEPSRVFNEPKLSWTDVLPYDSSGQIVLARVKLNTPSCTKVEVVDPGVRRYIGAASASKVRQYALEGERHIDPHNSAKIYFHVRGRQPNAVTLYLRAEKFSTLFYTEMGQHSHGFTSPTVGNASPPLSPANSGHSHALTKAVTRQGDGAHEDHKLWVTFAGANSNAKDKRLIVTDILGLSQGGITLFPAPVGLVIPWGAGDPPVYNDILPVLSKADNSFIAKITEGRHTHGFLSTARTEDDFLSYDHIHTLNADGSNGNAGVSDVQARSDAPNKPEMALTYIDELHICIDGEDKTKEILAQLRNSQPSETWDKLGNGKDGHVMVAKGTGEIKLDFLGMTFDVGEHCIELCAPDSPADGWGGRILYNLYVE
jgi:hypothetical protein